MVVDTEPLHGQHVATGGDLVDLGHKGNRAGCDARELLKGGHHRNITLGPRCTVQILSGLRDNHTSNLHIRVAMWHDLSDTDIESTHYVSKLV